MEESKPQENSPKQQTVDDRNIEIQETVSIQQKQEELNTNVEDGPRDLDAKNAGTKYSNVNENFAITEAELRRLKQFYVLDEVKESTEDDNSAVNSDAEESPSGESVSEEVPDEEIEKMLDENLPDWCKGTPKPKEKPYEFRRKIVLEEKGINHFEVLPSGWLAITHSSGMPIYLHKQTRVCTLSKPYLLGPSSARRHNIPVSAIPCLNYKKALEEEAELHKKETERLNAILKSNGCRLSSPLSADQSVTIRSIAETTGPLKTDKHKKGNKRKKSPEPIANSIVEENLICPKNNKVMYQDILERTKARAAKIVKLSNEKESMEAKTDSNSKNLDNSKIKNSNKSDNIIIVNNIEPRIDSNHDNINAVAMELGSDKSVSQNKKVESSNGQSHGEGAAVDVNNLQNAEESKSQNETVAESTAATENEELSTAMIGRPLILPGGIMMPTAKIETAQENWKKSHLSYEEITEYCKKLFKFKIMNTMKFSSWLQKRKFSKMRKAIQRPTLPDGTKLISFPVRNTIINTGQDGTAQVVLGAPATRQGRSEWIMNPNGRSYVCIFHEYVQRVLKDKPTYVYEELENAATPYLAMVSINGVQYGVGYGTSKRQAKSAAAKASLEILIPDMKDKIRQDGKIKGQICRPDEEDFSFFDHVAIDDPRIAEFCEKTMEPSPHSILETCLLRNFGSGDRDIKCEVTAYKHKRIAFTMSVGKHKATIICKNKKDGKQRASQAILQALHPHITSWGSLLRLYGSRTIKNFKEKKQEEQEITLLQSKAAVNQPNYAILEKLQTEMIKLHKRDSTLVPIGSILVQEDLPIHSGSNLKNVDL